MRVRQIVMNGLTNAVKYSNAPENGAIRVVLRTCAAQGIQIDAAAPATTPAAAARHQELQRLLCVEVLDRGPGLRGLCERVLFTDFGAPTVTTGGGSARYADRVVRIGSSGVGLPICHRYERAMAARQVGVQT